LQFSLRYLSNDAGSFVADKEKRQQDRNARKRTDDCGKRVKQPKLNRAKSQICYAEWNNEAFCQLAVFFIET
jgi:hypothetical protein